MGHSKDIINQRFGKLVVVREISVPYEGKMKNRKTFKRVECNCDCGNIIFPFKSNILAGKTQGCPRCSNARNYVGKRVGKIEIIERFWKYDAEKNRGIFYKIRCDCGHVFEKPSQTTKKLKGIRCEKCPTKPRPLLSKLESISLTNYKKHLKCKEKKIGQKSGRLKCIKFFGWRVAKHRRYSLYLFKCKCGAKIVRKGDIIGRVFSCGCLQKDSMKRGEENPRASLKNSDVRSIKELFKTNLYTQREIAEMYDVTKDTISHIKKNKTYKEI